MSLRQYVNLVTSNGRQGIYSLRRLNSERFFYPANEAAAKTRDLPRLRRVPPPDISIWMDRNKKKKKKKQAAALSGQQLDSTIRPPRPIFNVRPTKCPMTSNDQRQLHWFPLSGTKIFFADGGKRTALYDAEAGSVITSPFLHARKKFPVSFSVPSSPVREGEQDQDGGSLYILDTTLSPRNTTPFEALVWRHREDEHFTDQKTLHCDALPRPPYLDHRPADKHTWVSSYALVGDVICVSVTNVGTYCFDTVSRTWSLAGDWLMPFSGKAEYDPELKLWFGANADNHQLPCAADLSLVPRGHAPKKRYIWGRDPHPPGDWLPDLYTPANIVSLGSGRFCIINFFRDLKGRSHWVNDSDGLPVVVFSGLQVLAGNGKDSDSSKGSGSDSGKGNGLRMIKHKSRLFKDTNTHSIHAVL